MMAIIDSSSLTTRTRLPHMGWNCVEAVRQSSLFEGMDMGTRFYFLHSCCFQCHNDEQTISGRDRRYMLDDQP
jgi:glutamine amidotransferase